jgi:hypothetical protein
MEPEPTPASAALLERLEILSQARPDRVLRLRGTLPLPTGEAFELVIFRGFSSSTTHPTAFDPDQPALAEGARITSAELLQGPLKPGAEQVLAGPSGVEAFLESEGWR